MCTFIFVIFTFLHNNDAAKIGKVAFFEPEIEIEPDKNFLPFTISFCMKINFKPLEVLRLFVSYISLFFLRKLFLVFHFLL